MNKNIEMYCPKCHNKLIDGKLEKFETICEHVEDPNRNDYPLRPTWVCENPLCPASKENCFWDASGDLYGGFKIFSFNEPGAAYPSLNRRLEIEIYKKGVKDKIYLHPILTLWFLQPIIEFNYKADDWGNVLKRTWSLKWLKKDDGKEYCIYYTFPLVNIYQSLKRIFSIINSVKQNKCSETYLKSCIKDQIKPIPKWDKRWWRHVDLWLSKILFKKYI